MNDHLYVLSNPSVPGVVKVGKTKSSLDQKLAELHASDDPIPLLLEFYAEVADCEKSEQAAHEALSAFRVSPDLKFFRIPVDKALELIKPVIGAHTAVDVSEVNRPLTPEEVAERKRMLADRKEAERVAQEILHDKHMRAARKARKNEIALELIQVKKALRRLGRRPVKNTLSVVWFACMFCFSPLPVGWIVWLGTAAVFLPGNYFFVGCACILILVFGGMAYKADLVNEEMYKKAMEPFDPVENQIRALMAEYRELRQYQD